jgi:hypothetical protein
MGASTSSSNTSGYNLFRNNTSNQVVQSPRDTTISSDQYMGCYKDEPSRDLPYVISGSGFSTDTCHSKCKSHGYQFFGRQYDGQCFCGNSYGKYGQSSGCDCDGDNVGAWKNCVYKINGADVLDQNKTTNNNSVASGFSSVNKNLQKINYYDNDIKKMQELLQLAAKKGNMQLVKLYRDEIEIATKGSLVGGINRSIEKQKDTISLLIMIFVLIILLIIPLVFFIMKKISGNIFSMIVILDFILIALIIAWTNNILYIKSFFTTFGSDLETTTSKVNSQLQTRVNDFNNIVKKDVYGSESEFQAKYCCPSTEEEISTEIINDEVSKQVYREPGFYYDDGSAPQQLLVPDNTKKLAEEQFDDMIAWSDFDKIPRNHSLMKGSKVHNKVGDRLVGDTTYTRNL